MKFAMFQQNNFLVRINCVRVERIITTCHYGSTNWVPTLDNIHAALLFADHWGDPIPPHAGRKPSAPSYFLPVGNWGISSAVVSGSLCPFCAKFFIKNLTSTFMDTRTRKGRGPAVPIQPNHDPSVNSPPDDKTRPRLM